MVTPAAPKLRMLDIVYVCFTDSNALAPVASQYQQLRPAVGPQLTFGSLATAPDLSTDFGWRTQASYCIPTGEPGIEETW